MRWTQLRPLKRQKEHCREFREAFAAAQNLLGLVCDPVAGLVEVPCVRRNAIGAGNALIAADMALAGITNVIRMKRLKRCTVLKGQNATRVA